jgi:hypothetical protein
MFPNQMAMTSMTGMKVGKKKTRRGSRGGRGKNKAMNAHHAQAQTHLANAAAAPTPKGALIHLFKGLTALNKANKGAPSGPPMPSAGASPANAPMMPPAGNSGGMPNG